MDVSMLFIHENYVNNAFAKKHFNPFDPHESAMWKEVGEGGSDQAS